MSVSNSADLCTGYYFTSNTSEDIPDEGEVDSVDEGKKKNLIRFLNNSNSFHFKFKLNII